MVSPLVDFHCHLDLYPNYAEMFSLCAGEGTEVLAVTTTPRAFEKNLELAAGCPSIRVGLGLHPQLIAEGHEEFLLFERLLGRSRYVGEVGLDAGPRFFKSMDAQRRAFERVLRCSAEHGNKIISIHSVRTTREVLSALEKWFPQDRGKAVLHWFSGSKGEAKRATELGCFFSINLEMFANDSRREVLLSIPLERVLTETDGPFTSVDDKPAKPADVKRTLSELAALHGLGTIELRTRIYDNLISLEQK
jgi:TatD DNase family protein